MRLDHVSYVASHDQISDVVQRIGSQIGTAFVDGGIHPRFGTRNFTAPLLNGQYIEVVCPLDHPAAEQTPFGKAVTKKANEGGGWLSWVFSTEDIAPLEERFGRKAVEGHRRKPDGRELNWKQIGVIEILDSAESPFFIEWLTDQHPSKDGKASASIQELRIQSSLASKESWIRKEILEIIPDIKIVWEELDDINNSNGIDSISFLTSSGLVIID